ncbi:MAG: nuclear transport factor 2 family protein [Ardenticatenaceae bacterium]|nr:nuclear transport factor 2 family protein [Ardenticatenaceae bacterium]MCB8988469.1 nuclear transport factor 2 family protein [Ardenticatenaceae bacterium]
MRMTNQQLIETFYTAFQQRDHTRMNACYHPEVHFSDPVFQDLHGRRAQAMWHMLCARGTDLQITFNAVQADGRSGHAHWEAAYTFSTGRPVHNVIDAAFQFQDGLIIRHQDQFDLWRWTRMALGPTGLFLGWTPMVQQKVRATAVAGLDKFIAQHPEYQEAPPHEPI